MDAKVLPVHVVGFTIDESLILALRAYVQEVSQRFALDLDTLEGISIASNFRDFTKEFNTGFGSHESADVSGLAVGFTPQVLRGAALGSHIIVPKSIIIAFGSPEQPESTDDARYTIAHELAHADEHHRSAKQFEKELIALHMNPDPLQVGRRAVWSEYYVCRKVASAHPAGLSSLEELLVRSTEEFSNDCNTARARIAASNDKAGVHGRLCGSAFRFFIDAARLLGHVDGLGREFNTSCRIAVAYLDSAKLTSTFEDLHSKLRTLWDSFPNWFGLSDLQSILVTMDTVLKKI